MCRIIAKTEYIKRHTSIAQYAVHWTFATENGFELGQKLWEWPLEENGVSKNRTAKILWETHENS